jgi:hypothetical protein
VGVTTISILGISLSPRRPLIDFSSYRAGGSGPSSATALIAMDSQCDGLPGGIRNSIAARSLEGWSLVSAEDPGSEENLCDGLELHPP